MSSTPSTLWLFFALPLVLRYFRSQTLPSRDSIIPPNRERVVLLGASSGVGRDLAHIYAKRGARICLVARRADSLETVKKECIALGAEESNVLLVPADVSKTSDLLTVRQTVVEAWGGLDTLHILAGVPSTSTLLEIAGVKLASPPSSSTMPNRREFTVDGQSYADRISGGRGVEGLPTTEGLERVAAEARACGEINYVGTVIALACFLPLLASTSTCPALHHLSSVAAGIPTPSRTIYSATKSAALMAVEACRVECEGCGVRFFSLLPGTIANGFRNKTATGQTGGRDETQLEIRHSLEHLLLPPEKVTEVIMHHLALNPSPAPLIPYPPFSWIPALRVPPKSLVYIPWLYRVGAFVRDTPLGWLWVEPSARRKYGIPG